MRRILNAIAEYFEAKAEREREQAAIIGICARRCELTNGCG